MVGHGSPSTSLPLYANRCRWASALARTASAGAGLAVMLTAALSSRKKLSIGWRDCWPVALSSGKQLSVGWDHWRTIALVLAVMSICWPLYCAEQSIRLRVVWGGGAEKTWYGSISLSSGTLAAPQCLGVEADEPG